MSNSTATPPYPNGDQAALDIEAADGAAIIPIQKHTSVTSRIWDHLQEPVRPSTLVEVELSILTFCTGIQDAISFPDYHCFASNQTGNTVLLMVALLSPSLDGEMFITANIGAALGFFLLAGWITGQLGHFVGPRRRIWLICCNFAQSCLVFAAAAIQYRAGIAARSAAAVAVTGLLAFASGSQVVQSRALATTEISTAMATAAWVDLVIDPHMLAWHNRPRNRRVCFLLSLAGGALTGAAIARSAGSSVALLISAAGKLLVAFIYLLNGADKPKRTVPGPDGAEAEK
ncbi:hypothetical protein SLS62_005572 [Diatrype stigma]|uniref:DUF1275 domain protein n=1 Tax=Diatrype stigma TaxID=117547 RepID=A0AAN9YSD0_9PEZI